MIVANSNGRLRGGSASFFLLSKHFSGTVNAGIDTAGIVIAGIVIVGIVGSTQPGVAGIVISLAGISRAGIVIAGISTAGTLTPDQQTRWWAFATAGQAVTVVMAATVSK